MDTRLMELRRLALAEAIRHASLAEQAPNDDAVVETAEKFLKFLAAELNGEKARPGPLIVQPSADAASAVQRNSHSIISRRAPSWLGSF